MTRPKSRDPLLVGRDARWLRLYAYCQQITELPAIEAAPLLRSAQEAIQAGDAEIAVSILSEYFEEHGLDVLGKKPALDHEKFRGLWATSGTAQKDLALQLGVSPSAVSQFASGKPALKFMKVVVSAEIFGVSPVELITGFVPKPRLAVLRSRRGDDLA